VKDNGIGLEVASLAGIFELFAQTHVPGEAPTGLGIGLSLARQFAEMHGGTLHAVSEGRGHGSEFVLSLPVVLEGERPQAPRPGPVAVPGNLRKILVVDDNVDAANTLEALLDMDGFAVTTAYNGVAAVAAAEINRPDVVVMDIGMPGMNGYDAARLIRQQPGNENVILIALTGWGQATDKTRASLAGFDHHLVKPVDYDQLMSCLSG
jgi:CheY-like chemotaxis protein